LALVHLPAEKESWIVSGTQSGSLLVINTEDTTKRHTLEKMTDSVTCLYCNSFSKQRYGSQLIGGGGGHLYLLDDLIICKIVTASAKTAGFNFIFISLPILREL
jgi:leucine-rich repeat kinase 2